jgi:hypothetical protein
MSWARRLRATYYSNGREEMCWAVFRALHGDRVDQILRDRQRECAFSPSLFLPRTP